MAWLSKLFGDPQQKELRRMQPLIDEINELEADYEALSDDELRDKTTEFRGRYLAGESLDDLLPEAFAAVREASKRALEQRHFDVQLMGGIVLHQGKIAEMKTGEGKTLVATLPAYLNALTGRGVHLVTVNDYLAKRDCGWNGRIFDMLGMTTAAIVGGDVVGGASFLYDNDYSEERVADERLRHLRPTDRHTAYAADITYGTNNEFGFDYLRDNLATSLEQCVQRELNFAIVDEVDNILIDEARTPLIISGPAEEPPEMYYRFARAVTGLVEDEDYTVDHKMRAVSLTDVGIHKMERLLGVDNLYAEGNFQLAHHLEQAVKAQVLFKRDRDYIVENGEVIIIDEFTGRKMVGRRYSEGLHQALEAKENVKIERENVTQATITFQNYFRLYKKLAGMTGTAETEAEEFHKIYHLDVVVIPTNMPMIRDDEPDLVYMTEDAKFRAVVEEVKELHEIGQPVLVGTISIEKSERLSDMLTRVGVPHEVLNAKNHEREALIIAKAGQKGAVTISTNMAGRGTDIKLGEGVIDLGGLRVIGTERHESRRIDNQLRGRSGRQGDPGSSRFYVSLEDDLMRRVGSDRVRGMLDRLGMTDEDVIENRMVSRSIESAQTKVEGWNFDVRKHVVEYDDVINQQRTVIYADRRKVLEGEDVHDIIMTMIDDEMGVLCEQFLPGDYSEHWDLEGLLHALAAIFPLPEDVDVEALKLMSREEVIEAVRGAAHDAYEEKEESIGTTPDGTPIMRDVERQVMLMVIDSSWIHHIDAIDELRESAWLSGIAQRDPLVEFKQRAFDMFQRLQATIQHDIVRFIFGVQVQIQEPAPPPPVPVAPLPPQADGHAPNGATVATGPAPLPAPTQAPATQQHALGSREAAGVRRPAAAPPPGKLPGRNDPCYCGSGLKYKKCHGR
ncbi:MAG TPA: preprotein translocase subunit SecA [Chloroflexota bacterium]|nr:preprotein translocase subunit SecA [Chloroflexota bacterium]